MVTSSHGISITAELDEVMITATMPRLADPDVVIGVRTKHLLSVLEAIDHAVVDLTVVPGGLQVGPSRTNFHLATFITDLRPLPPTDGGIVIPGRDLMAALQRVTGAADSVVWPSPSVRLTAVGTDLRLDRHESHSAATDTVEGVGEVIGQPSITISTAVLRQFLRLLKGSTDELRVVNTAEGDIWFAGTTPHRWHVIAAARFTTELAKNADPWIDAPVESELRIDKRHLKCVLRRARIVADDALAAKPSVRFEPRSGQGTLEVSIEHADLGYRDEIACSWNGPDTRFSLALDEFSGAVASLDREVRMLVHPGGAPIVITDGSMFRYMLLPFGPDWQDDGGRGAFGAVTAEVG